MDIRRVERAATENANNACNVPMLQDLHINVGESPDEAAAALQRLTAMKEKADDPDVKTALRMIRDVLALRCHIWCDPHNRQGLLELLDAILAKQAKSVDRNSVLQAYASVFRARDDGLPSATAERARQRHRWRHN